MFLVVAETVASPLFCLFVCLFFLAGGGYRSVSFQSPVFRHVVILPVRNIRKLSALLNQ